MSEPGAQGVGMGASGELDARASILLIGLRASGKSSLAAALAQRLGRPMLDLDDETAKYLGSGTISELFARYGEARFRAAEYRALVNQAFPRTNPGPVVALGGGTPTAPGAADFLRAARANGQGVVVYLRAEPAVLRARLASADNRHRPALLGSDVLEEVGALFAARDPLYRELASTEVDASAAPADVLDAALRALAGWGVRERAAPGT